MDVNFGSGTQEQQDLFMGVFPLLMNLPLLDHVDTTLDVDFVEDPAPNLHNEFAYTDGTYIQIKQDAPDFPSIDPTGQRYGMPFFNETVAHELAHALLSLVPAETQEALAALFATTVDEWSPLDQPWADRPLEGICETFKDAFLPRRYRSYSNRTNHHISISKYPEFRRIFRDGLSQGGGEIIPSYDLDWMKVTPAGSEPFVLAGGGGVWDTQYTQRPRGRQVGDFHDLGTEWTVDNIRSEDVVHQATLVSASEFEAWLLDGTVLSYGFSVPDPVYPPYTVFDVIDDYPWLASAHAFNPTTFFARGVMFQGPALAWTAIEALAGLSGGFTEITGAEWLQTDLPDIYNTAGPFDIEGTDTDGPPWATIPGNKAMWENAGLFVPLWDSVSGDWKIKGDASGTSFSQSITIDDRYFITQECGGHTYRLVGLRFEAVVELADWTDGDEAEHLAIRESALYNWLPELLVAQSPCGAGVPIVLPTPRLQPGPDLGGTRRKLSRITGG